MRLEESERTARLQAEHDRNARFGLSRDLRNLSEEEAISLALMMSRDEYDSARQSPETSFDDASLSSNGASRDADDADLRFALELSLAEAKSMQDD